MELKQENLLSRSFVIQFFEIMSEFGNVIPWLNYLKSIQYSTNPVYFRDQIIKRLQCRDKSDLVPYQLVKDDESKEFIGSILHFKKSPERFLDYQNIDIMKELESTGYDYLTCLQIRQAYRKKGLGHKFLSAFFREILEQHQHIWAVISDYQLGLYYRSMGFEMVSPRNNLDNLWIIKWTR